MKDAVLIKSYQNGISLLLNEESSFEEILAEVAEKFGESRGFFGKARMALSIDGRKVSDGEQLRLVDAIRSNSDIQIVCVVGKDEATKRFSKEEDGGRFYKGTLKNNQMIETGQSIVILGDVYPGCAVISAHDIIVLGGLYGEAYAGADGEDGHYVAALEMAPEKLKIGDFKYKSSKPAKWGIKPKIQPKIAYVKEDKVVLESLTKELLGAF